LKEKTLYTALIILGVLVLSGCSFSLLPGSGPAVIGGEPQTETELEPSGESSAVPLTDGFDFPVGDRDGSGWGVTGYRFMEWSNYSKTWHPGEDWNMHGSAMADLGKPVYAIANGIVRFSGFNSAQGNIVMIEHHLPDGRKVWSQYAHLHERWVSAGEIVWRRQPIGTVGRGPNNTFSPHLHFEIRLKYQPQNGWPRTNGQAWPASKVREYYADPSAFINSNRPAK
jgi:murein DD-endopeptidase MepM/ murein hydrolase activator NlpD